jgi:hypothetical protein
LKAKYYPNSDLLKAGAKKGSSFTLESIIAGLNVFKRGYIWRVGTGEKKLIFGKIVGFLIVQIAKFKLHKVKC